MKNILPFFIAILALTMCTFPANAQCDLNDTLQMKGNVVSVTQRFDSYNWVTCPDYTPMPGALGQYFYVTKPGRYAVIVTRGTCIDTSDCIDYVPTGIEEINTLKTEGLQFPNPSKGLVHISIPVRTANTLLEVYSTTGQKLYSFSPKEPEVTLELIPGLYYISLCEGLQREVRTLVVQE